MPRLRVLALLVPLAAVGAAAAAAATAPGVAAVEPVQRIRPLACPGAAPDTTRARVGRSGGRVEAGRHRVVVPRGGISATRQFTVHRASPDLLMVEVLSDGPIDSLTLVLSWDGCPAPADPSRLYIARMHGDTAGEWVGGIVDPAARTVSVRLESLSIYAIAGH
jgi:hypothetical protein